MRLRGRRHSSEQLLSWPPRAGGLHLDTDHASSKNPFPPIAGKIEHLTTATAESERSKPRVYHKLIARWRVNRSDWLFTAFVVILQISCGSLLCYKYATNVSVEEALGWGVVFAKTSSGALYPTLFFLILSMSRWAVTLMRNSAYLSSFINIDKFRTFHIRMAICAFVLSVSHTVGHLSGTFVHGSESKYHVAVAKLLGNEYRQVTYQEFISSVPGWTGIIALVIFTLIVLCSTPWARRWSFELFQYTHLLIYPMICLLMLHGTAHLLQYPVLGFVLAIPTALVLTERMSRFFRMSHGMVAEVQHANDEVVRISFPQTKKARWWSYRVGQYVLVRMPVISGWEWHPFTVSRCRDGRFELYVKRSGGWTNALSRLNGSQVLCVDGPFGAPAQQFYQYDHCIVIATGIGVTPCSAILDNMYSDKHHPWACGSSKATTSSNGIIHGRKNSPRLVDFYWAVPGQDLLPWFAETFSSTATAEHNQDIGIRLQVYITRIKQEELTRTQKLDMVFSEDMDAKINAGRPDYAQLFIEHYEKMTFTQQIYCKSPKKKQRIGVFFCGAKGARDQLQVLCYENTLQGVMEGTGLEYHFHPEVF